MSSLACRDCRAFQPRPDTGVMPVDYAFPTAPTTNGECRAKPPVIDPAQYRNGSRHPVNAAWPGVTDAHWCLGFVARDAGQGV